MWRALALLSAVWGVAAFCVEPALDAHGPGNAVTWNREVARIVFEKCASCHRPGGTAFSLMTFQDAQPRGTAIKDAVLARRMPPWGAVKGFGQFRNDFSLSQEQIELITKWVDGGIRRGNNPALLPNPPDFASSPSVIPGATVARVSGRLVLTRPLTIEGLMPERVPSGKSFQVVARLPGGRIEPLLWLHNYEANHPHPFLLRRPLALPTGAVVDGVPADATIALLATL